MLAVILWGLWLRFEMRAMHDYDKDEDCIVVSLQEAGSFKNVLRLVKAQEFGGYLSGDFYLLYPFVKWFGYNKWGTAIPHIAVTVLGFYFLYRLCGMYFKTFWGTLAALSVYAFNGSLIKYAFEARTYAVLPSLALGTFYFMHRVFYGYERLSTPARVGIGAFIVATIWFHPYGIVIVGLCGFYFLLSTWREAGFGKGAVELFKFFGVVLTIALPLWAASMFGRHGEFDPTSTQIADRTFQYFPNPLTDAAGFLKQVFCNLVGEKKLYPLLAGMVLAFILPQAERFKQLGFFLVLVVLGILILLLPSLKQNYWFVQRHFVWLMPLFAFFLGWCLDSVIRYGRKLRSS